MKKASPKALHGPIHIIPGSHLDYGWAASPGECFAYITENIRMAIEDISGDSPDYKFTIEYALFMKHFLESHPEMLPVAKTLVKEGKLEVCPSLSGFIEHFLDGEMVIHQLVSGKRWIRETLGANPITAQHTDLPGHIIQIPQFLKKAGIQYFAYSRYHPEIPLHKWRAPNGDEVIAACHRQAPLDKPCSWEGYGWGWVRFVANKDMAETFEHLPGEIEENRAMLPGKGQPLLMGCESDLQPPEPSMLAKISEWNEKYPESRITVSVITQFFRDVIPESLPVYQGEAPYAFFALPSIYLPCALEMRRAENALAAGSKWAAFRQMAGMGKSPTRRLEKARDALALPHDHNTGGRRGEINDMERHKDALHARLEGESVLQEAAMAFTVNIDYKNRPDDTHPIVVFNSLSWERSDLVETYVELPIAGAKSLELRNSKGELVPCQITGGEDSSKFNWSRICLAFVAPKVPAHGYETFYLRPSKKESEPSTDLSASTRGMSNRFFNIRFKNNKIASIQWNGIELTGQGKYAFNEIYMLEDRMDNTEAPPWAIEKNYTGRAWRCRMYGAEVIENGPVRAVVRLHGSMRKTVFTQDIILYRDLERIDFHHSLDYRAEMHTQTRAAYPLNVPRAVATYESPYGVARLGKDEMPGTFRGHGERWTQKWIDLSNKDYGITLATRQISHAISESGIEPILARTSTCCGTLFYHFEQDRKYTFEYSIAPHAKGWKQAASHRHGWAINSPLASCNMTSCFPIKPIRLSRNLPERAQCWGIDGSHAVLTSIAAGERPCEYVLRLVEYYGQSKSVQVSCCQEIESAEEVNFLLEKISDLPCDKQSFRIQVEKHGIHTIKVRLKA